MKKSNTNALPKVSVIIPVYNNEKYLKKAIESALAQDYSNLEIIAVNDGSTDNSSRILDHFDNHIKVVQQPNSGSAAARNRGITEATGRYIAFLDADDLWVPWKIKTQVSYLEGHPDTHMVYNNWVELYDTDPNSSQLPTVPPQNLEHLEILPAESGWLYSKLLLDCIVHTSAVMATNEILEEVGFFDEQLRRGQDYDYWLRASQHTTIVKLDSILSAYRIHDGSITYQPKPTNFEALVLQKALSQWGLKARDGRVVPRRQMRDRLAKSWGYFASQHYRTASFTHSMRAGIKMIKYKPFWHLGWALTLFSGIKLATRKIMSTSSRGF